MGIWQNVGQQLGSMAKQAGGAIVNEPFEVLENAVGAGKSNQGDDKAMKAMEQGVQSQQQQGTGQSDQSKGFKTPQDFQKYQQLSGNRDEMEKEIIRKQLFREYGLNTDVESGMQQARMEFEQKEEQRNKVEENKQEEEKWVAEQKKKEDMSVVAAKQGASAENQAWGAG